MEEYLTRLNDKKAEERCKGPGDGTLGESTEVSLREILIISEGIRGDGKECNNKERETREGNLKGVRHRVAKKGQENEGLQQLLSGDNIAIQSLLKETMAGSTREVIKDELQAWLGLKSQQLEEDDGVNEMTETRRKAIEETEEGELYWSKNHNEGTPSKWEEE